MLSVMTSHSRKLSSAWTCHAANVSAAVHCRITFKRRTGSRVVKSGLREVETANVDFMKVLLISDRKFIPEDRIVAWVLWYGLCCSVRERMSNTILSRGIYFLFIATSTFHRLLQNLTRCYLQRRLS